MVGAEGFELEPFCGRERSRSPLAKSRAESRDLLTMVGAEGFELACPFPKRVSISTNWTESPAGGT